MSTKESRPPLTILTWQMAVEQMAENKATLKQIGGLVFLLQVIQWVGSTYLSAATGATLIQNFNEILADTSNYKSLTSSMAVFITQYLCLTLPFAGVWIIGYFTAIQLATNKHLHRQPQTLLETFKSCLAFLPKGIVLFFAMMLCQLEVGLFGQLRIFSSLLAMAPVLCLVEQRGAFRALVRSLLLKYTSSSTGGAFLPALALVTIGTTQALLFEMLIAFKGEFANLDQYLHMSRHFWIWSVGPVNVIELLTQLGVFALKSMLFLFGAFFTTNLYFLVVPRYYHRV